MIFRSNPVFSIYPSFFLPASNIWDLGFHFHICSHSRSIVTYTSTHLHTCDRSLRATILSPSYPVFWGEVVKGDPDETDSIRFRWKVKLKDRIPDLAWNRWKAVKIDSDQTGKFISKFWNRSPTISQIRFSFWIVWNPTILKSISYSFSNFEIDLLLFLKFWNRYCVVRPQQVRGFCCG